MKKKRIFVNSKDNKTEDYMETHISVGHKVIVVDGSYMTEEKSGKHVYGIQFQESGKHELLEVISVNVPRKTHYGRLPEVLNHHNNCQIRSNDSTVYNCSLVNIRRFEGEEVCNCCGQTIH